MGRHSCRCPEGLLWVDSGGSIRVPRTAAIGASRPLRRIPAIVSFLNQQLAVSLVIGNRSSCPIPAVCNTHRNRLSGVGTGHLSLASQTLTGSICRF